jgi:hypothetical protein
MNNVFSNIVLTIRGKNCICDEFDSMDTQKVYAALLEAYNDPLSINLSATKLGQELTLMKLDDKWRKSFESFIHFWTAKVQDLEGIENKSVDDETKRIWLTNTLSSQSDMDAAICQAITTQLTIHGTKGGSDKTTVPWTNFYKMVLSNPKLLDSTCSKQMGDVKIPIKPIKTQVVIIKIVITVPVMLIRNLALPTLVLIWSWKLVCVLALLTEPNSPKLRKISLLSLRNRNITVKYSMFVLVFW